MERPSTWLSSISTSLCGSSCTRGWRSSAVWFFQRQHGSSTSSCATMVGSSEHLLKASRPLHERATWAVRRTVNFSAVLSRTRKLQLADTVRGVPGAPVASAGRAMMARRVEFVLVRRSVGEGQAPYLPSRMRHSCAIQQKCQQMHCPDSLTTDSEP